MRTPGSLDLLHVIVPLKALADAKTRLSSALGLRERQQLMVRMFDHVVTVCLEAPSVGGVLVVAGDAAAERAARAHPVEVLADPGGGLNAAVARADARLATAPATLVLAADLPGVRPGEIEHLVTLGAGAPCVLVAPTNDGGTGGLLRRPAGVIAAAYGHGSCARHLASAQHAGVRAGRVHLAGMGLDVDRPEDLSRLGGASRGSR